MNESKSFFYKINSLDKQQVDEDGVPLNGLKVYMDDCKKGKKTLLRFINGFLDGDQFDNKGNLLRQKPAVESEGHQEYWRKNRLHRDNDEPAVLAEGFTIKEYWKDGKRYEKDGE